MYIVYEQEEKAIEDEMIHLVYIYRKNIYCRGSMYCTCTEEIFTVEDKSTVYASRMHVL